MKWNEMSGPMNEMEKICFQTKNNQGTIKEQFKHWGHSNPLWIVGRAGQYSHDEVMVDNDLITHTRDTTLVPVSIGLMGNSCLNNVRVSMSQCHSVKTALMLLNVTIIQSLCVGVCSTKYLGCFYIANIYTTLTPNILTLLLAYKGFGNIYPQYNYLNVHLYP